MSSSPRISFLIATDDHPPDLDLFFDALISQSLPPSEYEVVIVDASRVHDYSAAYARCLKRKSPDLTLIYKPIDKGGRASAYNYGLGLTNAPIILFLGDDCLPPPKAAEVHLRFHEQKNDQRFVGISSALLADEYRESHFCRWLETSGELFGIPLTNDTVSIPKGFFYTANTSVKRELLDQAGPFVENFRYHAWDDYELGLRLAKLGMTSVFLPDAKALHMHNISLEERCERAVQAGESARVFERLFPGLYTWQFKGFVSPWLHRLRAKALMLLYRATRNDRFLVWHYKAKLAASFAAGYRNNVQKLSLDKPTRTVTKKLSRAA